MAHETANIKWIPSQRRFGAENQMTWGGDLEGIIILRINQCYSCTCCPHHPHPPRSTSRAQLPLRTVGHWCAVVGWKGSMRAREREGDVQFSGAGRDWEREEERRRWRTRSSGTRPQPTAKCYERGRPQNGLELEYAQKGTEQCLVAVAEIARISARPFAGNLD